MITLCSNCDAAMEFIEITDEGKLYQCPVCFNIEIY